MNVECEIYVSLLLKLFIGETNFEAGTKNRDMLNFFILYYYSERFKHFFLIIMNYIAIDSAPKVMNFFTNYFSKEEMSFFDKQNSYEDTQFLHINK